MSEPKADLRVTVRKRGEDADSNTWVVSVPVEIIYRAGGNGPESHFEAAAGSALAAFVEISVRDRESLNEWVDGV